MPNDLPPGAYEQLVTRAVEHAIEVARSSGLQIEVDDLEGSLMTSLLARHVGRSVPQALASDVDPIGRANRLLADLDPGAADDVSAPPRLLRAVRAGPDPFPSTYTPLSVSALLTGAIDEPRLGLELEHEVATADEVDALISFVTWEGWRRLAPALGALARRGGRLRLITTTYTGATEAAAVDAIARLPGAQVRLSYDGRRTRLHAKAWLFKRASGFSTAWVGSANLSRAALAGGLEWTMKASAIDLPHVLDKFEGTFETMWNDGEFEPFQPDADRERLEAALDRERGGTSAHATPIRFFATLQPYPFQQEILDRLQSERELHGRHRNLIVAATGTGKTLISAFDYQRLISQTGTRPRLLFVAHRDELLQQSLEAYRHVLRDGAFGDRLGAGYEPASHDCLFTTVQSFRSRRLAESCGPAYWDYVVVDECHHSRADTYGDVVERLEPKYLVGLSATPERADGQDILCYFDGRIAAEVRLWHALDRQLVAPFDYFGVADDVDLSSVRFARKSYVQELDAIYSGNDRRAELVIEQFIQHRGNVREARALAFCVSVAHAEFMARKLSMAGIPAMAVHGRMTDRLRGDAPGRLERLEVNVLCTCDLYNEGVDLPFVDTLLLLRPTNSPTVFLQQLGRGLRLDRRKSTCLVLDFIGTGYRDFRFDRLFSAITGLGRGQMKTAVEQGFPTLPSGCSLRLDSVSRQVVLRNLRETLQGGIRRLAEELRSCSAARGREVTLEEYLEDTGRPLSDVYDVDGWTSIRIAAGLDPVSLDEGETALASRLCRLIHWDDPEQLRILGRVAAEERMDAFHEHERRRLQVMGYQLWHELSDRFGPDEVLRRTQRSPRLRAELGTLATVLRANVGLAPAVEVPSGWTVQLHRRYTRREILTAVGAWTAERKPSVREGVHRIGDDELFFVTLIKDEKRFSPTTRYRDYAISPVLFHWQSQSSTTADGPIGRRYREGGGRFWLFVRRLAEEPYVFLGRVQLVSHEGSKPMSITWRLQNAMPSGLFQQYASLAAG